MLLAGTSSFFLKMRYQENTPVIFAPARSRSTMWTTLGHILTELGVGAISTGLCSCVCVCWGERYHHLVCELNLDRVQLPAIDLGATTRPKKAGLCDWPPQRDVGLHFCKSWICFTFQPQAGCVVFSFSFRKALRAAPPQPTHATPTQYEWEDWRFWFEWGLSSQVSFY